MNFLYSLVFAVDQSATTGQVTTGCTLMMELASTSCFLKSFPSSSIKTWTYLACPIPETPHLLMTACRRTTVTHGTTVPSYGSQRHNVYTYNSTVLNQHQPLGEQLCMMTVITMFECSVVYLYVH